MNTIYKVKFFLIAIVLVVAFGCQRSFLDTSNPNQATDQNFWKTDADVQAALAATYSPLRLPLYSYWGAFTGFQDINAMGDDVFTIPGEEPSTWQVATFINDANNGDASSTFQKMYMCIYRANLVIANVDKVPIDDTKKAAYKAEAKFLRGLSYFILASNYGDVPLRLEPATTTDQQYIPATKQADVYKAVLADFTDASQNLPVSRPTTEQGRATSGAAIAFMGKVYLYMGDYVNAESTLDIITKAPYSYGLVSNFDDNFTDKNKFNQESIFQWVYGAFGNPYGPWGEEQSNSGMYNYIPQLVGPVNGGGWFKYIPSNYLVSQFLEEQRPAGSDTRFDKRMYTSLMWKYSNFGEKDTTWYGGTETFDDLWASCRAKISRFYPTLQVDTITNGKFLIKKMTSAWRDAANADSYWGPTPSTANYEIMRYAEVLLNLAEAAVQNGHNDRAIACLKQIRDRAGLVEKTSTDLPDKASIMAEIDHQKLLELFFEQNRWNDLKRWYTPDALKAHFVATMKQGANSFQAKNYLFPIPASELQTNNKMTQTSLWK